VGSGHPLLGAAVLAAVERAASAHRGRRYLDRLAAAVRSYR